MSKTYLRVFKKLKVLNDGSCVLKADNGCKSSPSLFCKDNTNHVLWNKDARSEDLKKDLSLLQRYKKKHQNKEKNAV